MNLSDALNLPGNGIRCAAAVILDREERVLLGLRHYKKKWEGELIANSLWTTPGGRTDEEETVGMCLVREALEETGLAVIPVEYWGTMPGARETDELHIFFCSYTGELENKEPEKFGEWQWYPLSDIPDNFINETLRLELKKRLVQ